MNIEHLTKSQIVLLTLFVSFVSSMATGIVVVTLMQQAPEPVLQSITNVVKTIEKSVPVTVTTPGKTIVVKDEDLMVAAIAQNSKSVIALKAFDETSGTILSAGVGTIVSSSGLIITDKGNFNSGNLIAKIDGVQYGIKFISSDKDGNLALGKIVPLDLSLGSTATSTSSTSTPPVGNSQAASVAGTTTGTTTPTTLPVFTPVSLGDSSTLKLGQTAIVIGGRDGQSIASGIITNLDVVTTQDKDTKVETKVLQNIGLSQKLTSYSNGAPIITLDGSVVGFASIDDVAGTQGGTPVDGAKKLISAELNPPSPATSTTTKKTL